LVFMTDNTAALGPRPVVEAGEMKKVCLAPPPTDVSLWVALAAAARDCRAGAFDHRRDLDQQ
jgi:hypothetical protein